MARNSLALTLRVMMWVGLVGLELTGTAVAVLDFLRSLDAAAFLLEGAMVGKKGDNKMPVNESKENDGDEHGECCCR